MKSILNVFCSAITLLLIANSALADLRRDRDEIFYQLLKRPSDTSLMLDYARLSVDLNDYEAAVATLERYLDIYPSSIEARYELALAYFALGSNGVANYHLNILTESGALTPEEISAAKSYQAAIDNRENKFSFGGYAEVGGARLNESGETGTVFNLGLNSQIDMGDANQTKWVTDFKLDKISFGSSSASEQVSLSLTSGPVIRLSGNQLGSLLLPYVAASSTNALNTDYDRSLLGVGVSYKVPVSAQVSLFGGAELGYAKLRSSGESGDYYKGKLGATWQPTRQTQLLASYLINSFDVGRVGVDSNSNAFRLDVIHNFRPKFADRDWIFAAYAQSKDEKFDAPRSENAGAFGVSMKAFVGKNVYVKPSVSFYNRDSTAAGFGMKEKLFSLRIGVEF